ncbi:MAG: AMP-binding protein [Paludibacteraceae bacterium]|nr:AMP-binding protein [Prevotellaceae bacterium]
MNKNSEIQFKSAKEIADFQNALLRKQMMYMKEHSPYYKKLFKEKNIRFEDIQTVADLQKVPVTTKKELQEFNKDFFCVPMSDITDIVTTSGTLGDPVTVGLTKNDLDRLAYNESLTFSNAGLTKDDTIQLMTTIDRRFMAGLAYFLGAVELGAGIIRVGNGIPELQWDTIQRMHPTCCMAVPSFLMKLIDYAEAHGIDYHNCSLKKAVCIGEALRNKDFSFNTLSQKLHDRWPELQLFMTYASTEMQTGFSECTAGQGGHLQPELIIAEFLGDNNQPVADHEAGEVTITHLGVEGMPLIRFKTGDMCYHHNEPCSCGRNTMRLSSVVGRKGQMIKYKGTTLYPSSLYDVIDDIQGVSNYVIEVSTNEIGTDDILIRIGTTIDTERFDKFEKEIKDLFRAKVRVAPSISFESPEAIHAVMFPQMSRKPIKFIDKRR